MEKEKVNAENESAKVEADKCAVIAKEVSEKQAVCEKELAAAEPLVAQAEAALDTLNKKDLGETKSLKKPPPGVLFLAAAAGAGDVAECWLQAALRNKVHPAQPAMTTTN